MEYAITLCLVILCLRAMTHLRIFDGTRYLIIMILKVFNEIASFLVIYVFFVLAYAIIWLKLSLLDGLEIDYSSSLNFSTNLAFGEYDSSEFTKNQWVMFLVGAVTLGLIMQNFLIAIISKTYEDVNEDKELNDFRAKNDIIIDFDQFLNKTELISDRNKVYFSILSDKPEEDEVAK